MKNNNGVMYKVIYILGDGTEYEDGIWAVTKTPKRIIAEKVEEYMLGIYAMHKVGEKIRIGKGTGNPIKYEDDDGEFACYFGQAGTPYVFTPITK
jgi:hypothetical protein